MRIRADRVSGPHAAADVVERGASLREARVTLVMVHGRGGRAEDMLSLADAVRGEDVAVLAPQATGYSWYPQRFTAPISTNEPWLSSGLAALSDVVAQANEAGVPNSRVVLVGFSQGACLGLEWATRHPRRYGGLAGLSGGLIGPDVQSRHDLGTLAGTPVLLGCSDVDAHIPVSRVRETAATLSKLGAEVDLRIYPGMGHTINDDEVASLRAVIARIQVLTAPNEGTGEQ